MSERAEIVVSGTPLPLTELAYTKFDQGRIDLIRNAVNVQAPLEIFYAFLELSARYDLDPLTGEIWLASMPGKNGGGGRVAVMVGRDGYLKVARRDEAFIDVDADVVYSKDEYRVTRKADGTRSVEHSYGNPAERGEAMGAYAVLRREGKPDRYFYAPLDQYAKNADKSAWSYRDSMVIKCATSYITRLTYGVSGAVPADEINGGLAMTETARLDAADAPQRPGVPEDLRALVDRAHALDPQSWRLNEVAARLPDPEDPGFDRAVKVVAGEIEAWLSENEPADAVVVDDRAEAGADAVETVDVSAELNRKWLEEPEWREQVHPLLSQYVDVETALDEAVGGDAPEAESLRARLGEVQDALDALGVPGGWWPATTSDAS